MGAYEDVNGDDPFESVAGGAGEEHLGVEVLVFKEAGADDVAVLEVVEVDADEAGVLLEVAVGTGGEGAGEGGVFEMGGLIHPLLGGVGEAAEGPCGFTWLVGGDVGVDVAQVDFGGGTGVGDGRVKEGEERAGGLDVFLLVFVGAVAVFKVEVELFVDLVEEGLAFEFPVAGCEVEAVAGLDVAHQVFVVGEFVGELLLGVEFLDPNVEGGFVAVPGVAAIAAVPACDVHHRLSGVELAEDVGVDAGAVVGLGEDGFFGDHSPAGLG